MASEGGPAGAGRIRGTRGQPDGGRGAGGGRAGRVRLRRARGQHIGRLFLRASRAFAALATRKLKEGGHEGLGTAHTALLPHLDAEGGTRATEVAERAGMTKQAAGRVRRGPGGAGG